MAFRKTDWRPHCGGCRVAIGVKRVASVIVVLIALFVTATAHAKPSKVVKFTTAPGLCGVNRLPEGGMGCFANALPSRPRNYGFIELHARGRAKISQRRGCPFLDCGGRPKRLRKGRSWSRVGVRCRHGNGLR